MGVILPQEQRDEMLEKLTAEQRDFIQNHVKRGKKTVFANVMAEDKGIVLPPNTNSEELEHLLEEWVLEDYIDNGFVNSKTPCECGRPLRYQYIVKHKSTNEVRRFGIKHFEEHTELPATVVAMIKRGFQTIEYEMDELLVKLNTDWEIEKELPYVPEDFIFPNDMDKHLKVHVPLLDRQIKRLKQQVLSFINTNRDSQLERSVAGEERFSKRKSTFQLEEEEPVAITLFSEEEMPAPKLEQDLLPHVLAGEYRSSVLKYLEEGVTSARIITELLIKNNHGPTERYSTKKPKLYVAVCFYLDLLVSKGKAVHIGIQELEDRYYRLR